jgi:uncharacterized protein YndB with AHSA1/START domain/DNA-binding transcriptional ArsR family regulator
MDEHTVFKALADDHRRTLLDRLFEQDGQTLGELCSALPHMTRHGCMKHLAILEDANLITTQKVGREKHHYLNPVPIQQVYGRWVSKFAAPWAQSLIDLKDKLEAGGTMQSPTHVMQIFIRTSPDTLWQALIDGNITPGYYFGSAIQATWEPGGHYHYPNPAGGIFVEGNILEIEPPRHLKMTFNAHFVSSEDPPPPSVVSYDIIPEGELCKLVLTHHDLPADHPATTDILEGWSRILSGLKTLLETGSPLTATS